MLLPLVLYAVDLKGHTWFALVSAKADYLLDPGVDPMPQSTPGDPIQPETWATIKRFWTTKELHLTRSRIGIANQRWLLPGLS